MRTLGIGPRDVKRVLLTHLHMDYDGGLRTFKAAKSSCARRRRQSRKFRSIGNRLRNAEGQIIAVDWLTERRCRGGRLISERAWRVSAAMCGGAC